MPDISMCSGEGCVIASCCYRHTAEPNGDRQSWFLKPPCDDKYEYLLVNSETSAEIAKQYGWNTTPEPPSP